MSDFQIDDKVLAVWDNGEYYPASIVDIENGRATVKWDDGSGYAAVSLDKIKYMNTISDFKAGEKVFAVWSDNRFYPATIKSIGNGEAAVAWDDGSPDSVVRFNNIAYEVEKVKQIETYELRLNGSIRGKIDGIGNVWLDGSQIGKYESNGDVRKNGSIIGSISDDGTVRKNGSIIGECGNCNLYQAAGFYFFFF